MSRGVGWVFAWALVLVAVPARGQERIRFDQICAGRRTHSLTAAYGSNHRIPPDTPDHFSFAQIESRWSRFSSRRTEKGFTLSCLFTDSDPTNCIVQSTVGVRRSFLVRGSTALAVGAGVGLSYSFRRLESQGSRANFVETISLVMQHAIDRDKSLTVEYQFSHTSNANLDLPNVGINTSLLGVGLTWYR